MLRRAMGTLPSHLARSFRRQITIFGIRVVPPHREGVPNKNNKHAYAGIQWLFYTSKSPIGTPGTAALRPSITSVVEGRGCPPSEMTCGWLLALAGTGNYPSGSTGTSRHLSRARTVAAWLLLGWQNTIARGAQIVPKGVPKGWSMMLIIALGSWERLVPLQPITGKNITT
jgi:hypothetical protein